MSKRCLVNDSYCSNNAKVRCKGYCSKHYNRFNAHGDPMILKVNTRPRKAMQGENWCSECSTFKDVSEFSKSQDRSNGRTSRCRDCASIRWRVNYDPKREKMRLIKRKYGLTAEQYFLMLREQSGVCAICNSSVSLHVDHDHITGKVRGLICFRCNSTLGKVQDNQKLLNKLIDYLEKYNER